MYRCGTVVERRVGAGAGAGGRTFTCPVVSLQPANSIAAATNKAPVFAIRSVILDFYAARTYQFDARRGPISSLLIVRA